MRGQQERILPHGIEDEKHGNPTKLRSQSLSRSAIRELVNSRFVSTLPPAPRADRRETGSAPAVRRCGL